MPKPERMMWVDVARALAVLAIVLMHVTLIAFVPFANPAATTAWLEIVNVAWPFHLSVLFVISGFLSADAIRAGIGSPRARRVIARSLYLYLVWQVVYFLLQSLGLDVWSTGWENKKAAILAVLLPRNVLWFLLAIAVWSLILALMHRVSGALVLALLAALNMATWWMPGVRGQDQYLLVLAYGWFFAVGVYARPRILRVVQHHPLLLGAVAAMVFVVGNVTRQLPSQIALAAGQLLWMIGAAAMVLAIARGIALIAPIGRVFSAIGRRTLSVYVLHVPLAAGLALVPAWQQAFGPAEAVIPLVLLCAITATAMFVEAVAKRTPARWLFSLPHRRERAPARGA